MASLLKDPEEWWKDTTKSAKEDVQSVGDDFDYFARDVGDVVSGRETSEVRTAKKNKQTRAQVQARAASAKDLFEQIKSDETISEVTRQELLFGFSELDPGQFVFTPEADIRGRRQGFGDKQGPFDTFEDIVTESFNPNLGIASPFTKDVGVGQSLVAPTPGASSIEELRSTFETALAGNDPKFATRQRRQEKIGILKDQPGSRQFLIEPPKKQTLTPEAPEVQALPSLLKRDGR